MTEQPTITQAQYESAVKGRQDFRNAYRNLLPVLRAAEGIVAIWRAKGRKVDVTEYWDAINAIDVAVTGGGAKPDPEHLTRTTSLAAQEVDSGMSGDAVERAEWFWANLPTGRKWTGLATHEKALVCHQIARITPSLAAQDGLVEALRVARKYVQNVVDAEGKAFNVRDLVQIDAALSAIKEQHHD